MFFIPAPVALQAAAVPPKPTLLPAQAGERFPRDSRDGRSVILGPARREDLVAHRPEFRERLAQAPPDPAWSARWKAVRRPITILAVFGSWCGDTHRELPDLLALDAIRNPFLEVRYLGLWRDKVVDPSTWPGILPIQPVGHVPTLFFFEQREGGTYRLVGSIVENAPKSGQRMGEAILEILESAPVP